MLPVAAAPEESVASTTGTRCFLLLLSVVEDEGSVAPPVLSCHPVVGAAKNLDPGPWQREIEAHVLVVA